MEKFKPSLSITSCLELKFLFWVIGFILTFSPLSVFGQLPSDFQKVELLTGLKNSVNMEFAPDGRIFICDRYGELIIYKPDLQTTVSAGTLDVFHDMEEGLLAIAFDPQFLTNNFIYLHYSHPTLPKNRVSRFKMEGDVLDLSSEIVVLEWQSTRNGYYHAAGDMDFDSQGNLYIAIGDNTNHSKYATLDESDPNKSSERTSSNTNDLRGKILRIKPLADGTYSIPEGNLFPDGVGGLPEIYVMGARNPFKMFVDRTNTDWLFWGEVGPDASIESYFGPEGLDELNITKKAGNFGWPYFAGKNRVYLNTYAEPNFYYDPSAPVNISQWNTGAVNLPPAQPAWMDFYNQCYLAGPRYYFDPSIDNPKKLPSDFDGVFFYYDFNSSRIWVTKIDNTGNLLSTEQLAPNEVDGEGFIDLKIGPDGQLYVLEYGAGCCPNNVGTGKLTRYDFTGIDNNNSPQVNTSADVTSGSLPLAVNFSSEGTLDLDGDELIYEWDFQSDGIVDSNEQNPSYTYTTKGTYSAQLRVNDSQGGISSKTISIYAGNNAATFDIVYPPNGGMINWWDNIDYKIIVNDEEDGTTADGSLECSQLNIVPSFGHLTHSHDGLTINQCEGTLFLDPTSHDTEGFDDIYQVINVNYTDSDGLTSFDRITLNPKLMEAEFYDLENNTWLIDNTDELGGGKHAVRALNHGAYLMLDKRNLINIDAVSYRVASTLGGQIEVHSGSPDGPLISTVQVPHTGSMNDWINVEAPITDPGGPNDLYFVFTNSAATAPLFDVNYIEFLGTGVSIDESPPSISFIEVPSPNKIIVKFNESLDKISAEQVSNYAINNGITLLSAALQADKRTVHLNTSKIGVQVDNELIVSNLKNESGIMIYNSLTEDFTFQGELFRINAGGAALELNGIQWGQNQYNIGGSFYSNTSSEISNTTADQLYQTEMYGDFYYNIPVPQAGIYDISLHFAELHFQSSGERIFNVDIENGQYALSNYDIFVSAGYATADIKKFYGINVEDGFLTITLTSIQNNAKVSAIEVFYGKETVQQPSITILDPEDEAQIAQPFYLKFQVLKWEVGEGTTHIHKLVDGVNEGEIYTLDSIPFQDLTLGQHDIQLVLVNADHSPTAYSAQIQVNVVDETACIDNPFPLQWTEQVIGSEVAYRSPHIFSEDLDGDGFKDIVTGAWWYKNPGTPGGTWIKKVIGNPMNNMSLIHDFDNDGDPDIFGTQGTYISSKMAWAQNDGNGNFTIHTNIPDGTSTYHETFMAGAAIGNYNDVDNIQIAVIWNGAESANSPVQMLTVPTDPVNQTWGLTSISPDSYGEDISAGDIDGDGDLDLFQAGNWLRNDNGTWTTFSTSLTLPSHFDRNALADLDNNGSLDGIVSQIGNGEEIFWFKPPIDPTNSWTKETIGSDIDGGLSLNLVDMDGDGDPDIVSGEWKGDHRLLAFENDLCNTGTWIPHVLHPGGPMDHHDSAVPVDLDNDGDLDLISLGWDNRIPRVYWNNSGENSSPVILNPLPDQVSAAEVPYTFTFAENTFSDPNGSPLSYTASLSDGGNLPSWLIFDGPTRTFSGTPGTSDLGTFEIIVTASDGSLSASDLFMLSVESETTTAVRINAGGGQLTAFGSIFKADQSFSDGRVFTNSNITDIAGTTSDDLYKSERFGSFSYNVPVLSGTYTVRLHFAEIFFGATGGGTGGVGKRVFNVTGEGQALLTNFDIYAEAGAMTALVKEFEISVTDGALNLTFTELVDNPKVSAIEIIAASTANGIVANPTALQFNLQTAGTSSEPKAITLTNNEPSAVEVTSFTITGDNGSEFAHDFTGPVTINAETSTAFNITFTPVSTGVKSAQLEVTHTDTTPPLIIDLSGEGAGSGDGSPSVINPISDQHATEGAEFSFTFAENTFSDPGADPLTYTASLSDGGSLPSWLIFDGPARTFSGTPGTSDLGTFEIMVTASDGSLSASDLFGLTVESGITTAIRVNAGGSQMSAFGVTFEADQAFSGGRVFTNSNITDIAGTTSDDLYKSERFGSFSYNFPVPTGTYTVRLHFAEIYFGATGAGTGGVGKRVFNVTSEGQALLTDFDIYAEVGPMTALVKEFEISVTDGALNLFFANVVDNPKVSAIEILSNSGPTNDPPVANAGTDQTVTAGASGLASVQLNGSGSTDAEGAINAYLWTEGDTELASGATPTISLAVGTHTITLTVTDGQGATATDQVTVTVNGTAPVNQAPVVANPIPDQNATEGIGYTFVFPEATFSDSDGDNLTYTAALSGGGSLPAWLEFDGPTRTFNGTPGTSDLGTLQIMVAASDGTLSAGDQFALTVESEASTAIRINAGGGQMTAFGVIFEADQAFSGGTTYTNSKITDIAGTTADDLYKSERYDSFSYNFPVPTGTYTVRLHFAEIWFGATGGGTGGVGSRVFNVTGEGQPLLASFDIYEEAGSMTALVREFEVSVTDGALNLFFSKAVNNAKVSAIEILSNTGPTNEPPMANAGPDQTVTADDSGLVSVQLNGSGSTDAEGAINAYLWTEGGTELATGATPTISLAVGTHTITLTVTDDQGATATDQVTVNVTGSAPVNQAPVVADPIPDQNATKGIGYTFTFSESTFSDPDGDALTYTAALSGGGSLPAWLSFDGPTRTFSGTPGASETVEIMVTASDGSLSASDLFMLSVESEATTAVRINAGGGELIAFGATFVADQAFSGGRVFTNSNITDIAGTTSDDLYKSERFGNFSYNFPVQTGTYTVRLHFAEIYFGATGAGTGGVGKRVFNVTGEGQALLTDFDIYAEVGPMTALVKEFEISVIDGVLNLFFSGVVDNAKVSAIEILSSNGSIPENQAPTVANPIPDQAATAGAGFTFTFAENTFSDPEGDALTYTAALSSGEPLPAWLSFSGPTRTFSGTPGTSDTGAVEIKVSASDGILSSSDLFSITVESAASTAKRINAGGGQLAALGATFEADQAFSGGTPFTNTQITDIAGTTADALYRSERYGNFSYNVEVPSGDYLLRLHFAEIFFGATGGRAGGAGSRVFHVTGEEQPLLTDFDIYAAAGSMTALVREFELTVADGTLNLAFVAKVNNPKVSAIEILSLTDPSFRIDLSDSETESLPGADSQMAAPETSTSAEHGSVVSVYPNPFEDIIQVRFQAEEPQEYTISLYDVSGRLHYQSRVTTQPKERSIHPIDLSQKSLKTGGVYLVFIESNQGNFLKIFKMVKK
ncbi:MAG: malectin domain-containing carbohydrate-binding protein [Anditalea sp.]